MESTKELLLNLNGCNWLTAAIHYISITFAVREPKLKFILNTDRVNTIKPAINTNEVTQRAFAMERNGEEWRGMHRALLLTQSIFFPSFSPSYAQLFAEKMNDIDHHTYPCRYFKTLALELVVFVSVVF